MSSQNEEAHDRLMSAWSCIGNDLRRHDYRAAKQATHTFLRELDTLECAMSKININSTAGSASSSSTSSYSLISSSSSSSSSSSPLGNEAEASFSSVEFEYSIESTHGNPLRGFFPYFCDDDEYENNLDSDEFIPYSLVYKIMYFDEILIGENQIDFEAIDQALQSIHSKNKQAVFRIIIDEPGSPVHLPQFFLTANDPVKLRKYTAHGGGSCPDWNNPRLLAAIEFTITQLAHRYDGDPRIAFWEAGLLGFWGEFHTYPHEKWFSSRENQMRILSAYDQHFKKTRVLVSQDELQYWTKKSRSDHFNISWHDDDFCNSTYDPKDKKGMDSDNFHCRLVNLGIDQKWKTNPIGGEMQPTVQTQVFEEGWEGQVFDDCIRNTHVTWLLYHNIWVPTETSSATKRVAKQKTLLIGYQFYLRSIRFAVLKEIATATTTPAGSSSIRLSAVIENRGNAPFYYPLTCVLTRIHDKKQWSFPGSPNSLGENSVSTVNVDILANDYEAGANCEIRLVSPHTYLGLPIKFANKVINHETGGAPFRLPVVPS